MPHWTDRLRFGLALVAVAVGSAAPNAGTAYVCSGGDIPECYPAVGAVQLEFERRFQGSYRPGEPYDVVTIVPNGSGETLESIGITLRVQIVCSCPGVGPIPGIPAGAMVLYSSTLRICSPLTANRDTDTEGFTGFTGTLHAGGCATDVSLFVDGQVVATLPLRFNSPDAAPPLGVDGSDLAPLAERLGSPALYSICFDFNEDGAVDASDLASFAAALGTGCE